MNLDPQLKSVLTSLGLAAGTAVASWAASKGLISSGDQATLSNDLQFVGATIVTGLIAWYKTHQVSQKSMIQAVNAADNGVKVVPASTPVPSVNEPIKPPQTVADLKSR